MSTNPPSIDKKRFALESPGQNAVAVTPNDSADLSYTARALYVGGAGNVKVDMLGTEGDATVTFSGIVAGSIIPVVVTRVYSTDTTATSIVAIW